MQYYPKWTHFRWTYFSYPLQKLVVSKPVALTAGEIIFMLPLIFITFISLAQSLKLDSDEAEKSGGPAGIAAAICIMSASRNSLITFVIGIPFERTLRYHKLFAYVALLTGALHGYHSWAVQDMDEDENEDEDKDEDKDEDRILNNESTRRTYSPPVSELINFGFKDTTNSSGTIFLAAMLLLLLTSLSPIRRIFWNIFTRLHILGALAAFAGSILHESGSSTAAFGLLFADMFLRHAWLSNKVHPKKCKIVSLPGGVMEISFRKVQKQSTSTATAFNYNAGQYVWIMIPKLGMFEWHPFSLSSSPFQEDVTIHVRVLGDWTKKLYELGSKVNEGKGEGELDMYLDGPCGATGVDLESERYQNVLLISGGVGVTPMQSICNQLMHEHEVQGRRLKKVAFIWAVKDLITANSLAHGDSLPQQQLHANFSPILIPKLSRSRTFESREKSQVKVGIEGGEFPNTLSLRNNEVALGVEVELGVESDSVLHTEFYLTRGKGKGKGKEKFSTDALNNEMMKDGRPDVPRLFRKMLDYTERMGESRVAVLCCGPKQLVNACKEQSAKISTENPNITFDFHSETFEF